MEEIESCFSLPYRQAPTRATVVLHRASGIGNGVKAMAKWTRTSLSNLIDAEGA
jgi:hypothetical protein